MQHCCLLTLKACPLLHILAINIWWGFWKYLSTECSHHTSAFSQQCPVMKILPPCPKINEQSNVRGQMDTGCPSKPGHGIEITGNRDSIFFPVLPPSLKASWKGTCSPADNKNIQKKVHCCLSNSTINISKGGTRNWAVTLHSLMPLEKKYLIN